MVGVGLRNKSVLARVSIVGYYGEKLLDTFVKVEEKVTDYRTMFSGIRAEDLNSQNAIPFGECRQIVATLIRGKILVGHGLSNDLSVLHLRHPYYLIRDTSLYLPFMRQKCDGSWEPRRLAQLMQIFLGQVIQQGPHDSLEDAASAMSLYHLVQAEWEQWVLHNMINRY